MTINLNTMQKQGWYHGDQRTSLPVWDAGSETGNLVLTMDHPMRELFVSNDDATSSLTVQVLGDAGLDVTFTLLHGEVLNERFTEFTSAIVTATGAWRWIVRSGRIS
jgi:hypothetical protein